MFCKFSLLPFLKLLFLFLHYLDLSICELRGVMLFINLRTFVCLISGESKTSFFLSFNIDAHPSSSKSSTNDIPPQHQCIDSFTNPHGKKFSPFMGRDLSFLPSVGEFFEMFGERSIKMIFHETSNLLVNCGTKI